MSLTLEESSKKSPKIPSEATLDNSVNPSNKTNNSKGETVQESGNDDLGQVQFIKSKQKSLWLSRVVECLPAIDMFILLWILNPRNHWYASFAIIVIFSVIYASLIVKKAWAIAYFCAQIAQCVLKFLAVVFIIAIDLGPATIPMATAVFAFFAVQATETFVMMTYLKQFNEESDDTDLGSLDEEVYVKGRQ